jgi:coiled-coil domain-containing protein 61
VADSALEKLRVASRKEVKRLRSDLDMALAQLEASNAAAEAAAVDIRRGEVEAVQTLRETNERLRAKVRELTQQLKAVPGRPYSKPVTSRGRSSRSASHERPRSTVSSRASTPGSKVSAVSRTSSARSRGSSVGSRGSSVSSGRGSVGRFDPTAYVREREEKLHRRREARNTPTRRSDPLGTPNSTRSHVSASSAGARGHRSPVGLANRPPRTKKASTAKVSKIQYVAPPPVPPTRSRTVGNPATALKEAIARGSSRPRSVSRSPSPRVESSSGKRPKKKTTSTATSRKKQVETPGSTAMDLLVGSSDSVPDADVLGVAMPPPSVVRRQAWTAAEASPASDGVDPATEISSIDNRLRALQSFLQQAKAPTRFVS